MICHETYKDSKGAWIHTDKVKKIASKAYHRGNGEELTIGRIEKMSKSKLNVVEPDIIVEKYGADTARLFLLSDSPPERDLEWTDTGVEGCYRYLIKLYKMVQDRKNNVDDKIDNERIIRLMHMTINHVTDDLEKFHMNKAIARIRELTNALNESRIGHDVMQTTLETIIRMLNPMVPHITEEMWSMLGHKQPLAYQDWPQADPNLLQALSVTIAVQINGKMRGVIELQPDCSQEIATSAAMQLHNVQTQIGDKSIKKVIFVKNKIINLICS
jgi:leucyl-tRNA synthetase